MDTTRLAHVHRRRYRERVLDVAQNELIDLLVRFEAIRFGAFTLKSGRTSPYFVNLGQLRSGAAMTALGHVFAATIEARRLPCDVVFGPSYKGVPLAVATAMALSERGTADIGFVFDRKEAKDHGEGGCLIGTQPHPSQAVLIVDDVLTSGMSVRAASDVLVRARGVGPQAVLVAVDRQERPGATASTTTREQLEHSLAVPVHAVVRISEVVDGLQARGLLRAADADAVRAHVERGT